MTAMKSDIAVAIDRLGLKANQETPVGDDAAAIPRGDGFDLLACEGMDEDFVRSMPWFAGWSSVMVNLSDIAAMGGTPTALVNAVWSGEQSVAEDLFAGMRAACERFGVPMVGGHTNLHSKTTQLAVAVLGHAENLLTSFDACPGHAIVMAVDLAGDWRGDYPFWDAATNAPLDRLRENLNLMPEIASRQLAFAAKDISQAGILGTATMLCETSRVGVEIDLKCIPRPENTDFERWLKVFPSFGFLLATPKENVPELTELFGQYQIASKRIGEFNDSRSVTVISGEATRVVHDFDSQPLMGC